MLTRAILSGAGLGVTVAFVMACGSPSARSPDGHASVPGSGTTTTSPTQISSAATAVPQPGAPAAGAGPAVEAYRRMWSAVAAAALTSDYESPQLAQYATGQALQLVTFNMSKDHQLGLVGKGEPALSPTAKVTGVNEVEISDCLDDSHWLKYRLDGKPEDSLPGGRHLTSASVMLTDGVWKVSRLQVRPVGTC